MGVAPKDVVALELRQAMHVTYVWCNIAYVSLMVLAPLEAG